MVTAMRRIGDYLKLIDIVIEVADARVPHSGTNPMLDRLAGKRSRVLILNREDLADPHATREWLARFRASGRDTIASNGREQSSVAKILRHLDAVAGSERGAQRAMIVGLPNSGKSSIINGLLRRAAAKVEDRAGVTRQLQWFRVRPNLELMDTPGILVPKIADAQAQWKLALVGAVPRDRYDPEDIATRFHRWVLDRSPESKIPSLEEFAISRGFVHRGQEADYHNAAQSYIKDFNDGKLGRITLEKPADDAKAT